MKLRFPLQPPRREDGTLLPAILTGALALMALLQLMLTGQASLPDEGVAGHVPPATAAAGKLPFVASLPIVMERPLFSPTRQVGGVAGSVSGAADAPLGGAVVAGAMSGHGFSRALLKLPNGTIRTLPLGGTYLDWKLVTVTPKGARFRKDGETLTLAFGSATVAKKSAGGSNDNSADEEQ